MKTKTLRNILCAGVASIALSACATDMNAGTIQGPPVVGSGTPYGKALACLGDELKAKHQPLYTIGVGSVQDRTGKFSLDNGGYEVTQAPDLMVITALGKSDAAHMVERLDTRAMEWELNLQNQKVISPTPMERLVHPQLQKDRWLPIPAGQIEGSDYIILGAVDGVDYDTSSGGAEATVNGIGGGAREWRMHVYADLRLVDSHSGQIVAVADPEKEFVGVEVQTGIFRFFGSNLFNIDAGAKANEPTQLGVRAMMERSTYDLLHKLYKLPKDDGCDKIADAVDKVAEGENPNTAMAYAYKAPVPATAQAQASVKPVKEAER